MRGQTVAVELRWFGSSFRASAKKSDNTPLTTRNVTLSYFLFYVLTHGVGLSTRFFEEKEKRFLYCFGKMDSFSQAISYNVHIVDRSSMAASALRKNLGFSQRQFQKYGLLG